jgi:hypothetical protein
VTVKDRRRRRLAPPDAVRLPRRPDRRFRAPVDMPADWVPGRYDGPTDLAGRRNEARFLASGGTAVAPIFRRNPGACMILLYNAQALDIPVAVALKNLHWSDALGAGGMTAQLMAGLLKRAGYRVKTTTETSQRVDMTFWGPDGKRLGTCHWTMADAIAAGVAGHHLWQAFPQDSLWARCLMRGARRYASEVGTGMSYTGRELAEMATPAEPAAEPVSTEVQEYLDEAATTGTTAVDIKTDILARARRAKLLREPAGNGRTLGEALAEMYGAARAREADQADRSPVPDPTTDLRPAGTGELECGCSAAQLAATGEHAPGCPHA